MRIIAGRLKGRRLRSPSDRGVRPTSEGLRGTLFNVLGDRVDGATVLDAFAGTGAIGLEALSRGAARVTFVEQDPRAIALLESNVDACGAQDACMIIRGSFLGLSARASEARRYNVVVIDPPYEFENLAAVVAEAGDVVAPHGIVVVEHSRRREAPASTPTLARVRLLTAGDSALAFYAPL